LVKKFPAFTKPKVLGLKKPAIRLSSEAVQHFSHMNPFI